MDKNLFLAQLSALVEDEENIIANLSNISALLNEVMDDINWVGFYLRDNNQLVLGPFQGKVACVRIDIGKGVCGTAALKGKTIIVDDVHLFSGHIACDSASNSEIVVPIIVDDKVIGVLDIDSPNYKRFSSIDKDILEDAVKIIEEQVFEKVCSQHTFYS
ncbi:MAG: GAF domain-containing protein [Erysipelotrichaceae bacterium]|nr:GAF domain-containing protein [Erysipelotrichaceae bacterium]